MEDKRQIYYDYFNEKILPLLEPLEIKRKKKVIKMIIVSLAFFIIGLFFAGLFIFNSMYQLFNPLILPLLLFFMYAFVLKSIINIIIECRNYKKELIFKVLPYFFEPIAKFRPWPKNLGVENLLESQLFYNFDTIEEESCFFGIYNSTNIKIAETYITSPIKGVDKSYLFKGTVIQLELPKSIDNHIIMISKNHGKTTNYKQFNPKINDLNKYLYTFVKKECELDFLKKDFWQIIKKFGEFYVAKDFGLSYKNNVLLITMSQKSPMQFGFLFKSLLKAKNYNDIIDRFLIIFDLVDILNS